MTRGKAQLELEKKEESKKRENVKDNNETFSPLRKQSYVQEEDMLFLTFSSADEDWGDTDRIKIETIDIARGAVGGKHKLSE